MWLINFFAFTYITTHVARGKHKLIELELSKDEPKDNPFSFRTDIQKNINFYRSKTVSEFCKELLKNR
jgi:hypothetical protein